MFQFQAFEVLFLFIFLIDESSKEDKDKGKKVTK